MHLSTDLAMVFRVSACLGAVLLLYFSRFEGLML